MDYPEPFSSSNDLLRFTQQALGDRGDLFLPIEREHTEAGVTGPLRHRLTTAITKRGFTRVAGHTLLTFSGYDSDPREIYEVSEIHAYVQQLDQELPTLPALLAYRPVLRYNGPGLYVMLLGEIAQTRQQPERRGHEVEVRNGRRIVDQALGRIHQAGQRYHLTPERIDALCTTFLHGGIHRFL